MPAKLVINGPTTMHNSPFLPRTVVAEIVTSTHFTDPRKDDYAG